jgi:endonuclease G
MLRKFRRQKSVIMAETDILKTAFSRKALLACKGYDSDFLHSQISVGYDRILKDRHRRSLPEVMQNADGVLQYSGLSVLFNRERRVPMVSAYNIDGGTKGVGIKRAPGFKPDFRIEERFTLGYPFYDLRKDITEFEIGHMAANNEMGWGSKAQLQAYQTFHFPNSVPQAEGLNTGLWKSLESYIIKEAANVPGNKKISVFSGPILQDDDPQYVEDPTFRIPLLFYKVIVFVNKKGLFSTGFIMSHEKRLRELDMFVHKPTRDLTAETQPFNDFSYNHVFQVNIREIEKLTGYNFAWPNVTTVPVTMEKNRLENIKSIGSSADAKKLQAATVPRTRGAIPDNSITDALTETVDGGEVQLNLILP